MLMTRYFILTNLFYEIEYKSCAGIAQLVEPHVANVIVAGSSPVSRSKEWLRFRSAIGVLGQWSSGVMGLEE